MRNVSVSEIRAYMRCREEHRLQYVDGYRLRHQAAELRFGTVLHEGIGRWWETLSLGAAMIALKQAAETEKLDEYETVRAEVMLIGYDARWRSDHDDITTVWVEKPFRIQRVGGVEPFALSGKVDAGGARKGRRFVAEHKTTGEEIAPGSDYWLKLTIDQQISLYALAAPSLGLEPDVLMYDVLRKPGLEPLRATPLEKRKYTKATAKEPARLYANQREHDETPEEFRARLVEEISEKPESYYARAEVVRLKHELDRALQHFDDIALDILRTEPGVPQMQNTDACRRFGSRCPFFGPCTGTGSIDSDHYVQLKRRIA